MPTSGSAAPVAATAAVFRGERRIGSAVLVDDARLLTARHVVDGAGVAGGALTVAFPDSGSPARWPVEPVAPEVETGGVPPDVAVLVLGEPIPGAVLPAALPPSPARRPPPAVRVFGFPARERATEGVWRDFAVVGVTVSGTVQVERAGPGTLPGHSGGPVLDAASDELVGVVVEGSPDGGFDRYLPLRVAQRHWPSLPHPWLVAGPEGRDHFRRRARGHHGVDTGGDRFRGRAPAIRHVTEWMQRSEAPGVPLVISGRPGAGKSAVLARAAFLEVGDDADALGIAVHARGLTHRAFLDRLAELVDATETAPTRASLVAELAALPERLLVAVDALDEAATPDDRGALAETLRELARLPCARVCVASRPLTGGKRYAAGTLFHRLGVRSTDAASLLDLDVEAWSDAHGLAAFAAAVLGQEGALVPGPPGGAWSHYREHPAVRDRLAALIAERAHGNFLLALLAARELSEDAEPLDPGAPGFDPAAVPANVDEFLDRLLRGDPADTRREVLLEALAHARGDGLDDDTWLRFAGALGPPADHEDLRRLRQSPAADYLLQATPTREGTVTRIFHQALVDALLDRRDDPVGSERRITAALLERVAEAGGWPHADRYTRTRLAHHAAAAHRLDELLADGAYLAVADVVPLLPLLDGESRTSSAVRRVLVRTGTLAARIPPQGRTQLLALGAVHLGHPELATGYQAHEGSAVRPLWAHHLGQPHRELAGHRGAVRAVAIGRVDGRGVIVSGGATSLQLWDPSTGQHRCPPWPARQGLLRAVALRATDDGAELVSVGQDGSVRTWDAADGATRATLRPAGERPVEVAALGVLEGRWVVALDEGAGVRVDDLVSGAVLARLPATGARLRSLALGRLDGGDVVLAGLATARLLVWDPVDGGSPEVVDTGHRHAVTAVGTGRLDGRDVVVTGGDDAWVRAWDVATGNLVREPLAGHVRAVRAAAVGEVDGRPVIVSGGVDTRVRVWDPADHRARDARRGHEGWVRAMAVARVEGRDVIVSGSDDRRVGLWDAETGDPLGLLSGHAAAVRAVAIGRYAGRTVVASVSDDRTVRLTDLAGAAGGGAVGEPVARLPSWARSVVVGHLDGEDVVLAGGGAAGVLVRAGGRVDTVTWPDAAVRALALGALDGRPVVVTGGDDARVHIRDARDDTPVAVLVDHQSPVGALAVGRLAGRDVVVSGGRDGTVRVGGVDGGRTLLRVSARVRTVALGCLGGRDVVLAGSEDHLVHLWDPAAGEVAQVGLLAPSTALALSGDVLHVASGRALCALRVDAQGPHWRPVPRAGRQPGATGRA